MKVRALAILLLVVGLVACGGKPERLVVAAASDLTYALPEIGAAFGQETGVEVSPTFAASKVLATQIGAGAPFDLFMSADTRLVDELVASGRCDGATQSPYAQGRLVMWTRDGAAPARLEDLVDPRFARIAIANPETAPYGFAARTALQRAGVWDAVASRIVKGDSVRHAFQLASSGNAEVAIVAHTLVIQERGAWTPVPAERHDPIIQSLAVCGARTDAARALARFVLGPQGQAILHRWGLGGAAHP